jgi:hypothetical protein
VTETDTRLTVEERIERLEKSLTEALNAAREHLASCHPAAEDIFASAEDGQA